MFNFGLKMRKWNDLTQLAERLLESDVQRAAPKALFHTELVTTKFTLPQYKSFIYIFISFSRQPK